VIKISKTKLLKEKKKEILDNVSSFQKEFRKHLTTFITGAFAFVAALVWRDAIQNSLSTIKNLLPNIGGWVLDYLLAFIITVIAVISIIIISKLLKIEENK